MGLLCVCCCMYLFLFGTGAGNWINDNCIVGSAVATQTLQCCQHRIVCRRYVIKFGTSFCVNRFFYVFTNQCTQCGIQFGTLFRRKKLLFLQIDGRSGFCILEFCDLPLPSTQRKRETKTIKQLKMVERCEKKIDICLPFSVIYSKCWPSEPMCTKLNIKLI